MLRSVSAALALLLCVAAPAAARPPSVELLELPSRLELPLPPGTNRLFEVRVGGDPDAVWVAADATTERRLALQPMGEKWVFNLGDPRVAEVLGDASQFQVFARYKGDRLAESLPVQFTAARAADVRAEAVRLDGGRGPMRGGWVESATVNAVALSWLGSGRRGPARVVAGAQARDVEPDKSGEVRVPIDAALRAAWLVEGTLRVEAGGREVASLVAVPPTVEVTGEPFRITQRRSGQVPGSRGFLVVHLGDISGGKVSVTLQGADGTPIAGPRLHGQGGRIEFALAGGRYVLVIERLVNVLIGDDHAELKVEPAGTAAPAK